MDMQETLMKEQTAAVGHQQVWLCRRTNPSLFKR